MHLTFIHYRIHGFLRTKLSVWNSFQREVSHLKAAIKTQRLANICKVALAPPLAVNSAH